ncbi:MAG TPA: universal stress protein [Terriglobales bacterium]|nr:universal stress protein [Terriglobales bacterium]
MALVETVKTTLTEQDRDAVFAPRNVLFATDFSSASEAAMPHAAAICRRFGATLHLAHILSDTSLLMATGGVDYVSLDTICDATNADAKARLEEMSCQLAGIPHRCYLRHGQVWLNLSRIVETNRVDLMVLGTHGRTGLGKLLLGSVAEDMLRHAACPVLTIGPKIRGRNQLPTFPNDRRRDLDPRELELRKVIFATNFAPAAARHAEVAVSLAQTFQSQLTFVHVIEDYTQLGSRPGGIEEASRRLRELIPTAKTAALQYPPETVLEFGSASERVLKVAEDREADLIVLGARPAAEAGTTHLPWSTAHHVIADAHCPVLTLRN